MLDFMPEETSGHLSGWFVNAYVLPFVPLSISPIRIEFARSEVLYMFLWPFQIRRSSPRRVPNDLISTEAKFISRLEPPSGKVTKVSFRKADPPGETGRHGVRARIEFHHHHCFAGLQCAGGFQSRTTIGIFVDIRRFVAQ